MSGLSRLAEEKYRQQRRATAWKALFERCLVLIGGTVLLFGFVAVAVMRADNDRWHLAVKKHIEETDLAVAQGVYRTGFRAGMVNAHKVTHLRFDDGAKLPSGAVVSNCLILQVIQRPPLFNAFGVTNVTLTHNHFYQLTEGSAPILAFDGAWGVTLVSNHYAPSKTYTGEEGR